jgi:hypothetical protein
MYRSSTVNAIVANIARADQSTEVTHETVENHPDPGGAGALLKALAPGERAEEVPDRRKRRDLRARTQHFPVDLGDGFRLDSIHAEGNAVVSTVTLLNEPAGPADPMMAALLLTASKSDTCREIAIHKQAYIDAKLSRGQAVQEQRRAAKSRAPSLIRRSVREPTQYVPCVHWLAR